MKTTPEAAPESLARALDAPIRSIMQEDVTTVRPGLSVHDLARVLSDEGISGVPVVAVDGRLLGVVSASDVVRTAAEVPPLTDASIAWLPSTPTAGWPGIPEDEADEELPVFGDFFLPEGKPLVVSGLDDDLGAGQLEELCVADIMTTVPFTVEPTVTVRELAGYLRRGRIHRALVTEEGRLVGIVTTMDILGAIADLD